MHKLLLISDHSCHAEALCRIFQALQFEVMSAVAQGGNITMPFCALAVLEMHPKRIESMLMDLRRRNVASKLLALVPLDSERMETRLARCGADDVLAFPVTRARLELTVCNLLRLHLLERAGNAVFKMEARVRTY